MKPTLGVIKKAKVCAVEAFDEPAEETIDSCAIPLFGNVSSLVFDIPTCTNPFITNSVGPAQGFVQYHTRSC